MKTKLWLAFVVCMVLVGIGYAEVAQPVVPLLQVSPSAPGIQRPEISAPLFTTKPGPNPNIWGGTAASSDLGKFNNPQGIAIDKASGMVYVTDKGNNRIQKFDRYGVLKGGWKIIPQGQSAPVPPTDITVDKNGNVYVSCEDSHIYKYSSNGNHVGNWGGVRTDYNSFNGTFSNNNIFLTAAVESNKAYIYTSEDGNIQKFDENGVFQWGKGYGRNNLVFSRGLAVGHVNNKSILYVADSYIDKIARISRELKIPGCPAL